MTIVPARPVMLVGHSANDQIFGAERSLLDILAAGLDGYEMHCAFPRVSASYLAAACQHAQTASVFPYRWWSKTRLFDHSSVRRFQKLFIRERIQIVHVNTVTVLDPLIAGRRLGLPTIVHA